MSLKCKICGYEHESNLIDHIESQHSDIVMEGLGPLESYLAMFRIDEEQVEGEVVLSEKPTKPKKAKAAAPVKAPAAPVVAPRVASSSEYLFKGFKRRNDSGNVVDFEVAMELGSGGEHVPELNMAYFFPSFSSNVLQDLQEKKKILLTGHAGCGKSSLFEQIAARVNQGIMRVNLNAQITIGDFVGMWSVKNGSTEWIDGVLPKAMREGIWLVLEEVDFAEPAILSLLNTVLENNGKLVLKEKGNEVIRPHENFRILATANTVGAMQKYRSLYQGTAIMNEAFLDRFRVYLVDYMPDAEETKVVAATIPRLKAIAPTIVRVANELRKAFNEENLASPFSTRRVLDWSELMLRLKDPMEAAEIAVFSKVSSEDAQVIRGVIQRIMYKPSES